MLYHGRHVISAENFSTLDLMTLFREADEMRALYDNPRTRSALRHILVRDEEPIFFRLFIKESTRTAGSFEDAIRALGGRFVTRPPEFSSIAKGESYASMARSFGKRCDCIIIRDDAYDDAATEMADAIQRYDLDTTIISAGCGSKEHPTQTLTDIYPAYRRYPQEFLGGSLTYAFVGDLRYSRTIHSFLLKLCDVGGEIYLIGPEHEHPPEWLQERLKKSKLRVERIHSAAQLLEIAPRVAIWYFTRLQKNLRGKEINKEEEARYADAYGAGERLRNAMNPSAIALHPLPHGKEYMPYLDQVDKRFIHNEQMDGGFYVRMALLKKLFARGTDLKIIRTKEYPIIVSGYVQSRQFKIGDVSGKCAIPYCKKVRIGYDWVLLEKPIASEYLAHIGTMLCDDHLAKRQEKN